MEIVSGGGGDFHTPSAWLCREEFLRFLHSLQGLFLLLKLCSQGFHEFPLNLDLFQNVIARCQFDPALTSRHLLLRCACRLSLRCLFPCHNVFSFWVVCRLWFRSSPDYCSSCCCSLSFRSAISCCCSTVQASSFWMAWRSMGNSMWV